MFDSISKIKKDKGSKSFSKKNNKYIKLEDEDSNKLSIILNNEEYSQVKEFGKYLGVDIDKHPYIIYTVWVALHAKLPPDWEIYETKDDGKIYFYNNLLKYSMWEHPLDECYRKIIKEKIEEYQNIN